MHAGGEQVRGGGVPQIVETEVWQSGRVEQRLEVIDVEMGAPQWPAGGIAKYPGLFGKTFSHRLGQPGANRCGRFTTAPGHSLEHREI